MKAQVQTSSGTLTRMSDYRPARTKLLAHLSKHEVGQQLHSGWPLVNCEYFS